MTDGAFVMTGQKSMFVSLLKQNLTANGLNIYDLALFHCILYQKNLCAQMAGEDTVKDLTDTFVKIINLICGSALNQ